MSALKESAGREASRVAALADRGVLMLQEHAPVLLESDVPSLAPYADVAHTIFAPLRREIEEAAERANNAHGALMAELPESERYSLEERAEIAQNVRVAGGSAVSGTRAWQAICQLADYAETLGMS